MSGEESILARWSRRKREAARAHSAKLSESPPSQSATAETGQAKKAASLPPAEAARESLVDLAKLPSLDSIAADTDLSAFLAPGVPSELRHAALRRAWSADPSIRDFVGLTENDWDVLAPAAAAGVRPLSTTDEMREWVDELFARPRANDVASEASGQSVAASGELPRDPAVEDVRADAAPSDLPQNDGSVRDVDAMQKDDAVLHEQEVETNGEEKPRFHRHGRALPR